MPLHIWFPTSELLAAEYSGRIDIDYRRRAKETIDRAAEAAGVRRILIDLTNTEVDPYTAKDALQVVRAVTSEISFGRVGYVLKPRSLDLVAHILSTAHGSQYFRYFHDRHEASRWLTET